MSFSSVFSIEEWKENMKVELKKYSTDNVNKSEAAEDRFFSLNE